MRFFKRLSDAYLRLMQGRYGIDSLGRFLIWVWLGEAVLNLVFRSLVLSALGWVLCGIVLYRMLSKNFVKRQKENADWYAFSQKFMAEWNRFKVRCRDRKEYRFFRCPRCKAPIRMPRMIGKFNVRCQKCGHTFLKEFKK